MQHLPSNNEVSEIAALAKLQIQRQIELEKAEIAVKEASENLRQVQEIDLPNAMLQAGVSEIRLPDGQRITLKEDVYASIPKDRMQEALAWLKENNLGDVIKNEIKVNFGKGQEEEASELLAELQAHGWTNYESKTAVHPSTLKALIREQLAKGANIPLDVFGAGPITKAIIK